jgi:hypothetical protein
MDALLKSVRVTGRPRATAVVAATDAGCGQSVGIVVPNRRRTSATSTALIRPSPLSTEPNLVDTGVRGG